jgi:hypothetical protein
MKKHRSLCRWIVICVLGLTAWGEEPLRAAEERFTFVAMGCMPYGDENFAAYERLLAEINRQRPAFTVHCGDTKGGGVPPTEAFLKQVHGWFDSLEGAAIYTPGDNEWTDVHRASNGNQDPAVWLAKVRTEYFSAERSMGRAPIPLVTQRREAGFEKFVENARWTRGGVVFATVHVVGSNNNNSPEIPGAVAEFRERDAANAAWVRATFAEARATGAAGVAFFFQAQPFAQSAGIAGRVSGFKNFLDVMEAEAVAWKKPVLLVNADEHRYRLEIGMPFEMGGEVRANVTRLATFGAGDIHAVKVTVDASSSQVFLCGPLLVPGNALPVLPRAKKASEAK